MALSNTEFCRIDPPRSSRLSQHTNEQSVLGHLDSFYWFVSVLFRDTLMRAVVDCKLVDACPCHPSGVASPFTDERVCKGVRFGS
jgi:hypothetical protein